MHFLHERLARLSPKQGASVEIPQAESPTGRAWKGLNVLSRAGCPSRRGFRAILKVGDE